MLNVLLIGLTYGIVGKYVILGNSSSNFPVPIIVGLVGAYFAHLLGNNSGYFETNLDPIAFIALSLGSMLSLGLYWLVLHQTHRPHQIYHRRKR